MVWVYLLSNYNNEYSFTVFIFRSNEPAQGGLLSTLLGSLTNRNVRDSENQNDNKDESNNEKDKDTSTTTHSPYYYKKVIRFSGSANANKSSGNLFDDIFNVSVNKTTNCLTIKLY